MVPVPTQKETFRYPYLPKWDVKLFWDRIFIEGYVMIPSMEVEGWEVFTTNKPWEDVFNPLHGPHEFPCDFVQSPVINDLAFSVITLGYYNGRCWPTGIQIMCTLRSCLFHSLSSCSASWWWCMASLRHVHELPVLICILVRCVMPILLSPCSNCDLNVSNNWFSDFLTLPRRVCKGGVKVSGWTS